MGPGLHSATCKAPLSSAASFAASLSIFVADGGHVVPTAKFDPPQLLGNADGVMIRSKRHLCFHPQGPCVWSLP
eukprot:10404580-Karenia_brevis.AAC.1